MWNQNSKNPKNKMSDILSALLLFDDLDNVSARCATLARQHCVLQNEINSMENQQLKEIHELENIIIDLAKFLENGKS